MKEQERKQKQTSKKHNTKELDCLIFTFFLSKKGSLSDYSRAIEHSSSVSMTAAAVNSLKSNTNHKSKYNDNNYWYPN